MIDRRPEIMDIDQYKKFSVMIPLIKGPDGYEVLFEVRANHLRHQPGEICFPGGGAKCGERPWETALRETCEELLIEKNQIVEAMPMDVFISPFNMIIHPFAALLRNYYNSMSTDEVAEVFTVPLSFFYENKPKTYRCVTRNHPEDDFPYDKIPGGKAYPWRQGYYHVIFYEYEARCIWGLTAKILKASLPLIEKMISILEEKEDDEKEKKQTNDYN